MKPGRPAPTDLGAFFLQVNADLHDAGRPAIGWETFVAGIECMLASHSNVLPWDFSPLTPEP